MTSFFKLYGLKLLIYLSLGLLVYYLSQQDLLQLTAIHYHPAHLSLSMALLFLGFFLSTFSWRMALKKHGVDIAQGLATYSHGISVFTKYIPGKIWTILGRAGIVKHFADKSLSELSAISLKEQFIYLFIGILISIVPSYMSTQNIQLLLIELISLGALFIILFSNKLSDGINQLLFKVVRRQFVFPRTSLRQGATISLYVAIYWITWTLAFYFLLLACHFEAHPFMAFAFPISVVYGLLAIFAPGGIGIREGIMVFILTKSGLSVPEAISFGVLSRIWFVAGEVFIFFLALVLKPRRK